MCALVSGDSRLRHLVEDQYSLVPETQIRSGRDVMMEELEASRLHGIQKDVDILLLWRMERWSGN